jgi:hypothetical protein
MSYVSIMAAFEFGDPVMLLVLVKTHDAPIHGEPQTRGLAYRSYRRAATTAREREASRSIEWRVRSPGFVAIGRPPFNFRCAPGLRAGVCLLRCRRY